MNQIQEVQELSDKSKALSSAYDKMLADRQSEMNNSVPAMRM